MPQLHDLTGSTVCQPARPTHLFVVALIGMAMLLLYGCVPVSATPGTTTWPFIARTASALQVATGSNVLTQVGGSISGTFRAFPLGEGVFNVDPSVTGGSNFGFDAKRNLYTFDYHILGVSDVANGDQLGWEGSGLGTYTEGCMTAAPDCAIRIDVTYDRLFGTGRYEDATGLIGEVIEVVWRGEADGMTTLDVHTSLDGWINY